MSSTSTVNGASVVSASDSISVHGWDSDGHATFVAWTNPVVVNQHAKAEHMVSWAAAQIRQLNYLLGVIGCAKHDQVEIDPAELTGSIRHQLEQVEAVLEGAYKKMAHEVQSS